LSLEDKSNIFVNLIGTEFHVEAANPNIASKK